MSQTDKVKATLDFGKVITNLKGEVIKDMIDPAPGLTEDKAPSLTLGSLVAQAFMIGVGGIKPKESFKFYQWAQRIDAALKSKDGKIECDEGEISQLEESFGKVSNPMFSMPVYAGPVMQMFQNAKMEILRKSQKKPE